MIMYAPSCVYAHIYVHIGIYSARVGYMKNSNLECIAQKKRIFFAMRFFYSSSRECIDADERKISYIYFPCTCVGAYNNTHNIYFIEHNTHINWYVYDFYEKNIREKNDNKKRKEIILLSRARRACVLYDITRLFVLLFFFFWKKSADSRRNNRSRRNFFPSRHLCPCCFKRKKKQNTEKQKKSIFPPSAVLVMYISFFSLWDIAYFPFFPRKWK